MARNKQFVMWMSQEEREAAKLAAAVLGYGSVAEMIREMLDAKIAQANASVAWFEAALERLGERAEED